MSNYHIKNFEEYFHVYRKSIRNPESFWEEVAEEHFLWRKRWDNVLKWDFKKPEVKWYEGGKLNITENCIDRHLRIRPSQQCMRWRTQLAGISRYRTDFQMRWCCRTS